MREKKEKGKERKEKERKEKEGREETVRSSSDLQHFDERNLLDQEVKFVYAKKATRRYQKQEA